MDIAIEAVYGAQVFYHAHQAFHRVVGIAHDAGTEEQPLDVVTPVEFHGEFDQFADRKRGAGDVVARAVDAVGTVIHAVVREHHFEQGYAASVVSKAVAYAHSAHGVAHALPAVGPYSPARRARYVVFRRFRQDAQFVERFFGHNFTFFFAAFDSFCRWSSAVTT